MASRLKTAGKKTAELLGRATQVFRGFDEPSDDDDEIDDEDCEDDEQEEVHGDEEARGKGNMGRRLLGGKKDGTEAAKEKKKREEEEQAAIEEAESIELAPGDYQIHVSVIEVKDLLAKDLNGTADPFIEVECLSTKKFTSTANGCLSAVYDETLIFEKPGLTKDDLEQATISIRVKDADGSRLVSTDMIGSYEFPVDWIYGKKNHEIYRSWLGLVNPEKMDEDSASKIQGYLKVTVAVLGPGDKLAPHDPAMDRMREAQAEEQAGGPFPVLMPTSMKRAPYFLVLTVHRLEDLPIMDVNLLGRNGTDAFVELAFGELKVKSKVCTVRMQKDEEGYNGDKKPLKLASRCEKKNLNQELWLPVLLPSLTKTIQIGMWDWDLASANECIGHFHQKFRLEDEKKKGSKKKKGVGGAALAAVADKLDDMGDSFDSVPDCLFFNDQEVVDGKHFKHRWINFYGSNAMMFDANLKELIGISNVKEHQNKCPNAGTMYKGRALVSLRLEREKKGPSGPLAGLFNRDESKPHYVMLDKRKKVTPNVAHLWPKTCEYQLRMLVVCGVGLPRTNRFNLDRVPGFREKLQVVLSIGPHEIHTNAVSCEGNSDSMRCEWMEHVQSRQLTLPQNPNDLPDIFLYLCKPATSTSAPLPFAYRRFRAEDLLDGKQLADQTKVKAELIRPDPDAELPVPSPHSNAQGKKKAFGIFGSGFGFGRGAGSESSSVNLADIHTVDDAMQQIHNIEDGASASARWNDALPVDEEAEKLFAEDQEVEVNYKGEGTWYPGRISEVNDNGTYDVDFADNPQSSLKDGFMLGRFDDPVQWVPLKEDPGLNRLSDSEFPGALLVRLGFGLTTDATNEQHVREWQRDVRKMQERELFEVRVHIYQAKELPPSDPDGSVDPYFKVMFNGEKDQRTSTKSDTAAPLYYETCSFRAELPPDDEFAPPVILRLYDEDAFDKDDYLGCCFLYLDDEETTFDLGDYSGDILPEPKWHDLYLQEPGDTGGRVLASVQLIRLEGSSLPHNITELPPPVKQKGANRLMRDVTVAAMNPEIVPEFKDAFVEITCVGLRDMLPHNFIETKLPHIEFTVASVPQRSRQETKKSKVPNGSNANFLERLILPCRLPINSLYAPSVDVRVKDEQLSGLRKPTIGTTTIGLDFRIPWSDNYEEPHHIAISGNATKDQDAAFDADEIEVLSPGGAGGGGRGGMRPLNVSSNTPVSVGGLEDALDMDSPGSPALPDDATADFNQGKGNQQAHKLAEHEKKRLQLPPDQEKRLSEMKTEGSSQAEDMADFIELVKSEFEPEYMQERSELAQEYESTPKYCPSVFETFELFMGIPGSLLDRHRRVGSFKGFVRVLLRADDPPLPGMDPRSLKPQNYEVRVYILDATGLVSKDFSSELTGEDMSDPYVKVRLGKDTRGHAKEHVENTSDLDWFKSYTFKRNVKLPGDSRLHVEVWDHDQFAFDDLIGSTIIDLEDRLLDQRWHDLGNDQRSSDPWYAAKIAEVDEQGEGGEPTYSVTFTEFDETQTMLKGDDLRRLQASLDTLANQFSPGGTAHARGAAHDGRGHGDGTDESLGFLGGLLAHKKHEWKAGDRVEARYVNKNNKFQPKKPVENRTLYPAHSSGAALWSMATGAAKQTTSGQGSLRMWVDILTPAEAVAYPVPSISLSETKFWELRVIVYSTKNVTFSDEATDANDLYCKVLVENEKRERVMQETDVHWRCRSIGSFNWRMKFKITLGPRTFMMKHPQIKLQLWDKDILKYNDMIAEQTVSLHMTLLRAMQSNASVQHFEGIPGVGIEKEKVCKRLHYAITEGKKMRPQFLLKTKNPKAKKPMVPSANESAATIISFYEKFRDQLAQVPHLENEVKKLRKISKVQTKKHKKKANNPISDLKKQFGLESAVPDNSQWVTVRGAGKSGDASKKKKDGEVLLGIEVVPWDRAERESLGLGREAPNNFPKLTPPTGRMKLSMNPAVALSQMFGDDLIKRVICCGCLCWCLGMAVMQIPTIFATYVIDRTSPGPAPVP
jgi:hypothetical protein